MHELIDSLRLLLKDESAILASPEDAAFFRASLTKSSVRSNKEIQPIPSAAPAPPIPKPIPPAEPAAKKPDPPQRNEAPPEPKLELAPEKPRHAAAPFCHARSQIEVLDSARQSQIEALSAERGSPSQIGKGDEEDRFGKVAASPKAQDGIGRGSSSIRTLLAKTAPELAILDEIPNDSIARKIANRWKTKNQSAPISVLSGGELPQHRALLEEIAAALDVYFGPARIVQAEPIEKEKQWESFLSVEGLKLILICDSTLWQLHQLRQFYKETPTLGTRMLGKATLFLLPDLSLYLKDPLLKRSLWKALCQKCS